MDTVTQATRSSIMRSVRSRGNRSTELRLRASLAGAGISQWAMNVKSLAGSPDFAFSMKRLALFVDGCFWHGCPTCYRRPASSQDYWDSKVRRNMERDERNNSDLRAQEWTVLRIWEHELTDLESVRANIVTALGGTSHESTAETRD